MDRRQRLDLQQRTSANYNPVGYIRALAIIVAIPFLVLGMVRYDISVMREDWQWRDVVQTKATVIRDDIEELDLTSFIHHVTYEYSTARGKIEANFDVPSSDRYAYDLGGKVTKPNYKFTVYYQPANPRTHVRFENPGAAFWESATRLGIAAGFGLLLVATVILLVAFYKPKSTRSLRRYQERLDVPGEDHSST